MAVIVEECPTTSDSTVPLACVDTSRVRILGYDPRGIPCRSIECRARYRIDYTRWISWVYGWPEPGYCPVCGRLFVTSVDMAYHLQVHVEEAVEKRAPRRVGRSSS